MESMEAEVLGHDEEKRRCRRQGLNPKRLAFVEPPARQITSTIDAVIPIIPAQDQTENRPLLLRNYTRMSSSGLN
ncbi:hypothetical protein Peur_068355 [Populus x canadensis]